MSRKMKKGKNKMPYELAQLEIKTNDSQQKKLWKDISSGIIPILLNSLGKLHDSIFLVCKYDKRDKQGNYHLNISNVNSTFNSDHFKDIEKKIKNGKYKKYGGENGLIIDEKNVNSFLSLAWEEVWKEQKDGKLNRAYSTDYVKIIPCEISEDRKEHCYLYIAVN